MEGQTICVPPMALEHIGKLCLEKDHAIKAGLESQRLFNDLFSLLTQIVHGTVQPGQLWIDLKAKTWAVREPDEVRKEALEVTRNGSQPHELAAAN